MTSIDSRVKTTDNQKAVIETYGFDVTLDKDQVVYVTDPALKKKYGLKDASKGKYFGKTLEAVLQEAVAARKAETEPVVTSSKTNGNGAAPQPVKKAGKGRALPNKTAAKTPIEIGDVELDNTGKREKKSRKVEKGPKKDNRYLRAAKIIVGRLDINAKQLSSAADMSESTASHCLEAWHGITKILLEKKWLKLPSAAKPASDK